MSDFPLNQANLYKAITPAANAGAVTIATVQGQACLIKSIVVRANAAQTTDLTGIAVTGGTSTVITFIDVVTGIRGNIAATDQQVAWIGSVELPAAATMVMTLSGSGATAVNLQVTIEYIPVLGGGYLY